MPPDFNRHASAHRVSGVQYTPVNALASVMLVTALIRELNAWADVPREDEADAA